MARNNHAKYFLKNGIEVPSVTTVLGELAKPALIHWAWKLGMEGKDYRKEKDTAAGAGSLAHRFILAHFEGKAIETVDTKDFTQDEIGMAENSYIKFLEYCEQRKLEPIFCETPFVSESRRFGGTVDLYWRDKDRDRFEIVDFKTSKDIYDSHFFQVAAYKELLREHNYQVDGVRIIALTRGENDMRFLEESRDDTGFEWEIFLRALDIWWLKKQLSERRK
jgi:hypothetical protein